MRSLYLAFLCFLPAFGFGQLDQLNGTYYMTPDGVVMNGTQITFRKNGTIKADYLGYTSEKIVILNPVPGETKVFEGDFSKREKVRIDFNSTPFLYQKLDRDRALISNIPFATSKKAAKTEYRAMYGKVSLLDQLKEKETKKEPVDPTSVKYFPLNPTSDFHKENVGKVVFFSEKPVIGQEDRSKIKTSFKVGEEVWAAAYLPLPLEDFSGNKLANDGSDAFGKRYGFLCVRMDNNDEELLPKEREIMNSDVMIDLKKEDFEKNAFVFLMVPNKASTEGSDWVTERMAERLGAFKHDLTVTLTDGRLLDREHLIQGTFSLDATEAGTGVYAEISKAIKQGVLEEKPVPRAAWSDADIERQMLRQIELYAHNKGWEEITFKRAIITSDWSLVRDELGDIRGRQVQGKILFKSEEGCGWMGFGFISDYQGGGVYEDFVTQYSVGRRGPLTCDKVEW